MLFRDKEEDAMPSVAMDGGRGRNSHQACDAESRMVREKEVDYMAG